MRAYPRLAGESEAYARQVLLHELVHCAQFEFLTAGRLAKPQWIMDGTADYIAAVIAQEWNGVGIDTSWWSTWLRKPRPGLFTRTYDAIGFWSLLAQETANVFRLLGPVVRAESSQQAYNVAVADAQPDYASTWGTTLAMLSPLGPDWELRGPGAPRAGLPRANIANGTSWSSAIAAKGADVVGLEVSADILHVVSTRPDVEGSLQDARRDTRRLTQEMDFCVRPGGCSCPDGPDPPSASYPKLPPGASFLGFANQNAGMALKVTGEKLECSKRQRDTPDASGDAPPGSGAAGIQVRDTTGTLLATLRSGTCRRVGRGFRADTRSEGWRLVITIAAFEGYGAEYSIPQQASFVLSGPRGTFRSFGSSTAGSVQFFRGGSILGAGASQGSKPDAVVPAFAGAMNCSRPTPNRPRRPR